MTRRYAISGLCALPALAQPQGKLKWEGRARFGPAWDGIPEAYRNLPFPEMPLPRTAAEWDKRRPEIRRVLLDCLGEMPARPQKPSARVVSHERRDGALVERIDIDNGFDGAIPALLAIPEKLKAPAPAILLLHWHSGSKEGPLFSAESQAVGARLIERGFVLLSIDCAFNGERLGKGPAGQAERNIDNQRDTMFKLNLWFGRTLFGMMLRDNMVALDFLAGRSEVDPQRLGASGMSMGSTGAWWLAALDRRVRAVVAVACFMRYRELVAHGQLRAHAMYFFVPGILKHFDMEAVLGLVAPRPLLALTGDSDPTSPPEGIRLLEQKVGHIYGLYGARDRFRSMIYPGVDHTYTSEEKNEMTAWFSRWLGQPPK